MPSDSDDLDWLYRRDESPRPHQQETRAMSEAELAELRGLSDDQRPAAGAPSGPAAGAPGRPPTDAPGRPPTDRRTTYREPARRDPVRPVPPPPPSRTPPATGPDRPRRRRHPVRRLLATLGVLLLALVVWLVGVPAYAWTTSNDVDAFPAGERPADQPGQLFLLVGSDSRAGLSEEEQTRLGTGSVEGARTDTMMLLYLPPSGRPALISVPRDSYVEIPDNGSNKINSAYAFGGAPLLTQTVEQNTGLRVDGYVEIGFGGFVQVIDAVGGVELCPEEAISDSDAHLEVEAGCQTMDGVTALGYARMRKADSRGDLGRVERQREVMAALAEKAVTPASVLNPVRYWNLNHAVAQSLTTDPGTGILAAGQLALAMGRIAAGDGLTLTVPVGDPDASTSVGSAVLWDEADAPALFDAIARGDTDSIAQFADR